ncbi:MAG: glucosaminidase domain-containing protein [Microthrixaceae bacterium]
MVVAVALCAPVAGAQEPDPGTSTTTTSTTTTTTVVAPPGPEGPPPSTEPEAVDDFVPPGGTTIPPTQREALVPPPIDLTSLNAVLLARREEAVAAATAAADAANASALIAADTASEALGLLRAEVPGADEAVADARSDERAATTELERSRRRRSDLAVESYTLALTGNNAQFEATTAVLENMDAYESYVRTSEYSGAAWDALEVGETRAERRLDQAAAATAAAIETRNRLEGRISVAQSALDAATETASQVKTEGELRVAEAAVIGEDLSVAGLGPTITGETLLSAEDLAEFSARRSGAAPSVDLLELARLFVVEGTAEGVRGDIAWAQSILETGNFGYKGSMVSTSDNNYAGIGACDSCSSGFRYDTPQMGVRAQMQLLHTYADDNLTTAALAFPPVRRTPEQSSVRGCCDTWMELSGVWATGPGYGVKILTIYNEMLAFAAQRQRAALDLLTGEGPL